MMLPTVLYTAQPNLGTTTHSGGVRAGQTLSRGLTVPVRSTEKGRARTGNGGGRRTGPNLRFCRSERRSLCSTSGPCSPLLPNFASGGAMPVFRNLRAALRAGDLRAPTQDPAAGVLRARRNAAGQRKVFSIREMPRAPAGSRPRSPI